MSKINSNDFYIKFGFMLNELHLKGTELEVYAIIYGFSKDNTHWFTGSQQYLCDWTNKSKQSIQTALNNLVEQELLFKEEFYTNDVKYCKYKVNLSKIGYSNNLNTPPETLVNNIYINNKDNNNINNNINNINSKNLNTPEVNAIYEYWNTKDLVSHKKLTDSMIREIEKALKQYHIDDILDAIDNYAMVVKDNSYYFNTVWPLEKFMRQQNALPEFTNEGAKWLSYLANKKTKKGNVHDESDLRGVIRPTKRRIDS